MLNHELLPSELFTPVRVGRAAARVARGRPRELGELAREVWTTARAEIRHERARRRDSVAWTRRELVDQ